MKLWISNAILHTHCVSLISNFRCFFIVFNIFHYNQLIYFCGKYIEVSHFDRQQWAYVGRKSEKYEVLPGIETSTDDVFLDSHEVMVYEVNNDLLIVPQYDLLYDDS